jgi:hypothetical protein
MDTHDLSERTRKDLLLLAKKYNLKGASRLRKEELLNKLQELVQGQLRGTPHPVSTTPERPNHVSVAQVTVDLARNSSAPTVVAEAEQRVASQVPSPECDPSQDARESKFFLGPQSTLPEPEILELPATYNDNRIVLLARDPHWLYAYWDFSVERMSAIRSQLGASEAQLILRISDVTYVDFNGANAWNTTDIELTPFTTNWYISVPQADTAYCVEVGYRAQDGRFAALGRSNVVSTPRAETSLSDTLRWFTPPGRQTLPAVMFQSPAPPFSIVTSDPGLLLLGRGTSPSSPAPSSGERPFSWGTARKA